MKLNADLGEGMGSDAQLMPLIDMANIAAGGHAGDEKSIRECLRLAHQYGVMVGIHPSYPDRTNFGRHSLVMSRDALIASIGNQCRDFLSIADAMAVPVSYMKPHGALYHDLIHSEEIFRTVLLCLQALNRDLKLMLLAMPNTDSIKAMADSYGVELLFESFADRAYEDSGTLRSRAEPGACLNHQHALKQAVDLCLGRVVTITGKTLHLKSDSLCVHGDNPEALALVQAIREGLPR